MTPEQFCYWLQGYFELEKPKTINFARMALINRHLQTVFKNVTETKAKYQDAQQSCDSTNLDTTPDAGVVC